MTDLFFDELIRISARESSCSVEHWLFLHFGIRNVWYSIKSATLTQTELWFEI